MCRDNKFINLAVKKTNESQHYFRMAAVVARGNRVLSYGVNVHKTHPRQETFKTGSEKHYTNSIHAELRAILGVPTELLKGSTIYIARSLRAGGTGCAKPCKLCQQLIEAAEIKRVVYTTGNKFKEIEDYELHT